MTVNDSPRSLVLKLATWTLIALAVVAMIMGYRGTATPMKIFLALLGFFMFLSQILPPSSLQRKAAAVTVADPEAARASSAFMIATSFMLVAWGTLDKEPWQLDLLYSLALGWLLIPALRRGLDNRKPLGGERVVLNLAISAKEHGAR
jgi:hypothetical protein